MLFFVLFSPYHFISPLNITLYLFKYQYKKVAATQSLHPDNRNQFTNQKYLKSYLVIIIQLYYQQKSQ